MSPQMLIFASLYALLVIGAGLALWGWLQARSFLKAHNSISSQSEFDEFKKVVKANMFLALAMMLLVFLILVLGVTGLYAGSFGWIDIFLVFLIFGPICSFAGARMTLAENRMKVMSLEDETFREEFDHVVKRWTSSAFPDW